MATKKRAKKASGRRRRFTLSAEVCKEIDLAMRHLAVLRPGLTPSRWLDRVLREALGLPSRGGRVDAAMRGAVAGLVEGDAPRGPLQ